MGNLGGRVMHVWVIECRNSHGQWGASCMFDTRLEAREHITLFRAMGKEMRQKETQRDAPSILLASMISVETD